MDGEAEWSDGRTGRAVPATGRPQIVVASMKQAYLWKMVATSLPSELSKSAHVDMGCQFEVYSIDWLHFRSVDEFHCPGPLAVE